jgi:erythromycin esterase
MEQRVRFFGLDITRNDRGRKAVLALLHTVDPDRVAATMTLFAAQAAEEAKWPTRIDDDAQQTIATLLPEMHALIEHLRTHADQFAQMVSATVVDQALQYTRVMEQWLLANAGDFLALEARNRATRSVFMAENMLWLMDRQTLGTKAVVWQANAHICLENPWDGLPNLGSVLRERYAERYFAFGLEFGQGSFLTRTALPDRRLGDLKVISLPPAPVGTLPWYLSQVDHNALLLNLRPPVEDYVIETWLHTSQMLYNSGWVPQDDETFRGEFDLTRMYDGIIFINSTTPIRPTASAMRRVAQHDGL